MTSEYENNFIPVGTDLKLPGPTDRQVGRILAGAAIIAPVSALAITHPVEAKGAFDTVRQTVDYAGNVPFAVGGGVFLGAEELFFESKGRGFKNPQIYTKFVLGMIVGGTGADSVRQTIANINAGMGVEAVRLHEDLIALGAVIAAWFSTKGLGEKIKTSQEQSKKEHDQAAFDAETRRLEKQAKSLNIKRSQEAREKLRNRGQQ